MSLELKKEFTPVVLLKRRMQGTRITDYLEITFLEDGEILIEYTIDIYTGLHTNERYVLREKPGKRLYRVLSEILRVFLQPLSGDKYSFEIEVYSQEAFSWLSMTLEKHGLEYLGLIPAT